jgi:hypothetical protein
MGLTTWKNAPAGPIRKEDVFTAKNYLTEREIGELNRIVTMYLDYAEDQAARKAPMHMADWVKKLDAFLTFNERNVLKNAGKVSAALAEEHARGEFEKYNRARLEKEAAEPSSDFDKIVEQTKKLEPGAAPAKKRKKKGE